MSDKSYAEATGHAPFDWNKWLDAAIENEPDEDELRTVSIRAREWPTCACGNQCAIIPRNEKGEPLDDTMASLGASFYSKLHVAASFKEWRKESIVSAKEIMGMIESRASVLIKQELAKLNQR